LWLVLLHSGIDVFDIFRNALKRDGLSLFLPVGHETIIVGRVILGRLQLIRIGKSSPKCCVLVVIAFIVAWIVYTLRTDGFQGILHRMSLVIVLLLTESLGPLLGRILVLILVLIGISTELHHLLG
jgi:hypothetical protein